VVDCAEGVRVSAVARYSPEWREKIRAGVKRFAADPRERARLSKRMKAFWANPATRARMPHPGRRWTRADVAYLRKNYADVSAKAIATALGAQLHQIYGKAAELGLRKSPSFKSTFAKQYAVVNGPTHGERWTPAQLAILRDRFPKTATADLVPLCGHSRSSIDNKAHKLRLRKDAAYVAAVQRGLGKKLTVSGKATRFVKGQVPRNKGLRRPGWAPGRMRETQFKKGQMAGAAHKKWVPIGTEVIDDEGYRKRKVSDERARSRFNWAYVHRLLWEQHYGPIPRGYIVSFIDGNRQNITLHNLVLMSLADNARRNNMWARYPHELAHAIQLKGAIKAQITRRTKREEHRRSA
jgi:hypothetical protein